MFSLSFHKLFTSKKLWYRLILTQNRHIRRAIVPRAYFSISLHIFTYLNIFFKTCLNNVLTRKMVLPSRNIAKTINSTGEPMRPASLFLQIVRKILKNSTSFVLFVSTKYLPEKRYCHRKILVKDRLYMWPMSPARLFFMIKSINWPTFVLRVFAKYLQEKSYCYRKIKTKYRFYRRAIRPAGLFIDLFRLIWIYSTSSVLYVLTIYLPEKRNCHPTIETCAAFSKASAREHSPTEQ